MGSASVHGTHVVPTSCTETENVIKKVRRQSKQIIGVVYLAVHQTSDGSQRCGGRTAVGDAREFINL